MKLNRKGTNSKLNNVTMYGYEDTWDLGAQVQQNLTPPQGQPGTMYGDAQQRNAEGVASIIGAFLSWLFG